MLKNVVTWIFRCKLKSELLLICMVSRHAFPLFKRCSVEMHESESLIWKTKVWVIRACQPEFLLQKFRFASISPKFTTRIFTRRVENRSCVIRSKTQYNFIPNFSRVILCLLQRYTTWIFGLALNPCGTLSKNTSRISVMKSELWVYCSNVKPMIFVT